MLAILLALVLLGCEPEPWLAAAGVPAFREVGPAEALRLLEDPRVVRLEVRPGGGAPTALPDGVERVLVVSPEETAGRRVSARLARAGVPRVSLVVADPRALALGGANPQPPGG